MNLRKATFDDLEVITSIEEASFPPQEAAHREDFERRLKVYPEYFWLLEDEGRVVSVINGMLTDEYDLTDELMNTPEKHKKGGKWLMIFGVATDPNYRGRGFAGKLMERVISDIKSEGRLGIVLTCKKRLIPFYERFGYVCEGKSVSEHGGAKWYSMRLVLGGEKNLDFDSIIERRGTNCIKYDSAKKRGMPENILPLWVADMDFRISSYIQEALYRQVSHGIYGYSDSGEGYFDALRGWMMKQHGWRVEESWLVKTPGVVFAIATAVRAFTEKGDHVLIQQPVYYPFSSAIADNGRIVANNNLLLDDNGRYHIDLEDFEKQMAEKHIKLFLLCNPHNPSGRVFTSEELTAMGDICVKYGVTVVSDEIHADFIHKGRHTVFADIKEDFRKISVTCTAPSKTFNIAGLQVSNIFIPDGKLRHAFLAEMNGAGYGHLNAVGLAACEAAYRYGRVWYEAMLEYVRGNISYIKEFVKERMPRTKVIDTEGTYLVWLDFRGYGFSHEEIDRLVIHEAGLWLDSGNIFGKSGEGFQRINAACPRKLLSEAMERLERAFEGSVSE